MARAFGNPQSLAALREFIRQGSEIKPDWWSSLPFDPRSERGSAFLLFAAALQGIMPNSKIGPFLLALWEQYGLQLFRLSHRPYQDLAGFVGEGEWTKSHSPSRLPGILRSVTDFFFREGSILAYLERKSQGEEVIADLADSIFWMGKSSPYRNKPRHFLWLAHKAGIGVKRHLQSAYPPLTPGHFQWVHHFGEAQAKKNFRKASPRRRLEMVSLWIGEITSASPWDAVFPLEGLLERRGPESYTCQIARGGCWQCPLQPWCPIGLKQGRPKLAGPS